MTINTNHYVLALAISVLSCITPMMANSESLTQDLIALYEEEHQCLLQKQEIYFQNTEKENIENIGLSKDFEDKFIYPVVVCKKYVSMLKKGVVWTNIESLISEYKKLNEKSFRSRLKKTYLRNIIAATFFDMRDMDKENITLAKIWADKHGDGINRYTAISYYLHARIIAELAKNDTRLYKNYLNYLFLAVASNPSPGDDGRSEVLKGLLDKLSLNHGF